MAGKPRVKKQKRVRLFVHPEVEPVVWAGGSLGPGQKVPKNVPAEQVATWWSAQLLIPEGIYQTHFSRYWNRNFPKHRVPPGVDVEVNTGDSVTEGVREV
jgi:hypothetical protein